MAHYALLNENNIVINVITGVDENIIQTDTDGKQVGGSSEAWEKFYASLPWLNASACKRTSYNHNIRKQYAGIDFYFDAVNDVFIRPQPYLSWSLDENFDWQAPVAMPEDGNLYTWNEETTSWELVPTE